MTTAAPPSPVAAPPPVLRRTPLSARELLLTLVLLAPFPLWAVAGGPGPLAFLAALVVSALGGFLLRRLPSPVPAISSLPAGGVWVLAVLLLGGSSLAMAAGTLAGIVLLLYTSLSSAGELEAPMSSVLVQVAVPVLGGALALMIALVFLGVQAPIYALVIAPTLGALALAVYLLAGREGRSEFGRPLAPPSPSLPGGQKS